MKILNSRATEVVHYKTLRALPGSPWGFVAGSGSSSFRTRLGTTLELESARQRYDAVSKYLYFQELIAGLRLGKPPVRPARGSARSADATEAGVLGQRNLLRARARRRRSSTTFHRDQSATFRSVSARSTPRTKANRFVAGSDVPGHFAMHGLACKRTKKRRIIGLNEE